MSLDSERAVLEHMRAEGIPFDQVTYEHIVNSHAAQQNVEACLQSFEDMHADGLVANYQTMKTAIKLAAQQGRTRLAMDLVASYEKASSRRLDAEVWGHILTSAAENHYASFPHLFRSYLANLD